MFRTDSLFLDIYRGRYDGNIWSVGESQLREISGGFFLVELGKGLLRVSADKQVILPLQRADSRDRLNH